MRQIVDLANGAVVFTTGSSHRTCVADADLGQDQKATIPPVFIFGSTWPVMVTDAHIKIGCQVHRTEEWAAFTDEQIFAMDGRDALRFWAQWKEPLLAMARAHQKNIAITNE
jgi:hypothetical protein